jgi:hypothetical protein
VLDNQHSERPRAEGQSALGPISDTSKDFDRHHTLLFLLELTQCTINRNRILLSRGKVQESELTFHLLLV